MNTVIHQFTRRASTYSNSACWISDRNLIHTHVRAASQHSTGHVLEVCCGTGMVGRGFQDAGWHVCGVDMTRKMAEEANRFFPCICTPAETLPFLDGAFDAVVLRQAYFLLEDGQKVLSEIHHVLKPDGVFVFSQTVPFSELDAEWLEKIHRTKQAQLRRFYTEETLVHELARDFFLVTGRERLAVREDITRWMNEAPELSDATRSEVCRLVAEAPEPYRTLHRVEVRGEQILEDWNWVVFSARKKQK